VTDVRTGKPVAGAHVGAFLLWESGEGAEEKAATHERRAVLLDGTTDAEGRCHLATDLGPEDQVRVNAIVRARGHAEWRARELRHEHPPDLTVPESPLLTRGGSVRIDVALEPGVTIAGVVTDAGGKGVASARIGLVLSHPRGCSWPHAFGVTRTIHWPPPCRTDETGAFDFLSFPVGHANAFSQAHFVLLVEHEEFAPVMVHRLEALPPDAAGVVHVKRVLERGSVLEGEVLLPSGAPAAGATVLIRARPDPDQPICVEFKKGVLANEAGEFKVAGLRPGVHTVEVEAAGCSPWSHSIDLAAPRVGPLVVRMAAGADVEGQVLHQDGTPVAGSFVFAMMRQPWYSALAPRPRLTRQTETDAEGKFRLAGLPTRGRVQIRCQPSVEVEVALPSPPLTLRVPALTDLRISLVAAESGAPLGPDGYVTVMAPGFSTILDKQEGGEFRRPGMPVGEYTLYGDVPDRAVGIAKVVVPKAGLSSPVVVRLPKGGVVRGRVTGPEGSPVAGATVVAHGVLFGHERRAATDASGAYDLKGLGRYSLLAFSAEGLAVHARTWWVLHRGGAPRVLDVRMGAGATVTGKVLRRDGAPVAGAPVTVSYPRRSHLPFELPSALSAEDGTFEIRHVPAGRMVVHCGVARERVRTRNGATADVTLRVD